MTKEQYDLMVMDLFSSCKENIGLNTRIGIDIFSELTRTLFKFHPDVIEAMRKEVEFRNSALRKRIESSND